MLTPEDLEAIRRIVREEIAPLLPKPQPAQTSIEEQVRRHPLTALAPKSKRWHGEDMTPEQAFEDGRRFVEQIQRGHAQPRSKPSDATSEYLSTAEAARLARVTPGTIRRWVSAGELSKHHAGAKLLVRRAELERLLSATPADPRLSPEERARRRFG